MTMKGLMKAHACKRPVGGIIMDLMDVISDDKEIVASNTNEDGSPSSKDENHASKVVYMTGQRSEALSGISGLHVRSALTSASPIQSTLPTLLQPWTLLNLPTQRSPRHQTQPTLWHSSDGNTYTRNI